MPYRAVLFDLDGTLADDYHILQPETIALLGNLLRTTPVAIVSGSNFERIQSVVARPLEHTVPLEQLFIFPDSASKGYQYQDGEWVEFTAEHRFTPHEQDAIEESIREAVRESGISDPEKIAAIERLPRFTGDGSVQLFVPEGYSVIIRETTQMRWTAFDFRKGRDARAAWDPDGTKRLRMIAALQSASERRGLALEIVIGGKSTIDITKKGTTKAFAVRWMADRLQCAPSEMLFIGDALYEHGNDSVVIPTGIRTRQTSGPEETQRFIAEML